MKRPHARHAITWTSETGYVFAPMSTVATEKPLFIPLKTAYFEAFAKGEKTTEYRPYGPRWNERTCSVGRKVTLSHGYGKARRLTGTIIAFDRNTEPTRTAAWIDCYGYKGGEAACIHICLD